MDVSSGLLNSVIRRYQLNYEGGGDVGVCLPPLDLNRIQQLVGPDIEAGTRVTENAPRAISGREYDAIEIRIVVYACGSVQRVVDRR
jgi:hypothetical protein